MTKKRVQFHVEWNGLEKDVHDETRGIETVVVHTTHSSDASVMIRSIEAFTRSPLSPTPHHFHHIEKTFDRANSIRGAFLDKYQHRHSAPVLLPPAPSPSASSSASSSSTFTLHYPCSSSPHAHLSSMPHTTQPTQNHTLPRLLL